MYITTEAIEREIMAVDPQQWLLWDVIRGQ